jgi:hypothetical protein
MGAGKRKKEVACPAPETVSSGVALIFLKIILAKLENLGFIGASA